MKLWHTLLVLVHHKCAILVKERPHRLGDFGLSIFLGFPVCEGDSERVLVIKPGRETVSFITNSATTQHHFTSGEMQCPYIQYASSASFNLPQWSPLWMPLCVFVVLISSHASCMHTYTHRHISHGSQLKAPDGWRANLRLESIRTHLHYITCMHVAGAFTQKPLPTGIDWAIFFRILCRALASCVVSSINSDGS